MEEYLRRLGRRVTLSELFVGIEAAEPFKPRRGGKRQRETALILREVAAMEKSIRKLRERSPMAMPDWQNPTVLARVGAVSGTVGGYGRENLNPMAMS